MPEGRIAAVTGATGFIGRHLVRRLLSDGFSVRILTRNVAKARAAFRASVEYVEGDLRDQRSVDSFMNGSEAVFHLASELNDRKSMQATNVAGTAAVLRAARNVAPKKLIHLSSAGVAGRGRWHSIDERTPCRPCNEYERTKLLAERSVREFAAHCATSVSIVRPTNVFGEDRDRREDSFYQLIRQIRKNRFFYLNNGAGTANYVYVGDVAGVLSVLSGPVNEQGGTYIVNDPCTMNDFVEQVRRLVQCPGRTLSLPYWPVLAATAVIHAVYPGFVLSPSRVKAMCSPYRYIPAKLPVQAGWEYEFGFRAGLERTIAWLEKKGWL